MQRRAQRFSTKRSSLPLASSSNNQEDSSKKKARKVTPLQALIYSVIALVSIAILLTPAQKHELVEAEHKVEEWVHEHTARQKDQLYNPKPRKEKEREERPKEEEQKEEDGNDDGEEEEDDDGEEEEDNVLHPEKHPEQEEEWEAQYMHPHKKEQIEQGLQLEKGKEKQQNPPSSRWVEGEKKLKEKLKILFDQQEKRKNLAVPVLTRYLGEEIPAFVGTTDSKMEVAEWKNLVEQKYKEMREEEEAWQKKMAEFIEKKDRDIGITTP